MLPESKMNAEQDAPQQLLKLVWQQLSRKDIGQAIDKSNQLVGRFPNFAPGWHVASHVAQLIKKPGSALAAIDRALNLEPGNKDWQLHRTGCLLMSGDKENTIKSLHDHLVNTSQFQPAQLTQLAFLCTRVELFEEAAGVYQTLIRQEPGNGQHWYNLATIQRFQGKVEQAEKSLDNAISRNSKDYEAYELRSDLRKQSRHSNHVDQLRALLKSGINTPAGEVRICYALAKELEDIGQAEESFNILNRGATLRRKHINYRIEDDLETIDAIIDNFDSEFFSANRQGHITDEPVFVIGLPRTGTTLVERILGSHPDVFAAGELNNFAMQLMTQVRQQQGGKPVSREALVKLTTRVDFQELGKSYIESTRPQTADKPRFVDKMPLNFLYAGLIRVALPQAKIVHLTRHPMDSCYAIYKRLFQDAYPWSYDLDEIATYYAAYHRLMTHWKSVIPGSIHELAYENLVSDLDGEARALIDYCGLEWDSRCVRFHESRQASTTASASQVRQPVYQSSVNRWKQYRQQLTPLCERLEGLGIALD